MSQNEKCKTSVIYSIQKKREGLELSSDEIEHFISDVVNGSIQDIQIGAMLMAIYLKGMTVQETTDLTSSMINSGKRLSWPKQWKHLVVDKHSTGGVGDKISLVLAPALAACGLKVPMISGRGLGITGGTLDKLESIPGFRVEYNPDEIETIINKVGCCIVGQTADIVPADKILYSFRDVTATIDSIPLTTASIISKKAVEGLNCLILDVKYGNASFMKTTEKAHQLASSLVELGQKLGIKTSAALSNMDVPVGHMIGNSLEVAEALHCLQGQEVDGLNELTTKLGGELLRLQEGISLNEGTEKVAKAIADGRALKKFEEMLQAQGVNPTIAKRLCNPKENVWDILPHTTHVIPLFSKQTGYVHSIDAFILGKFSHELGAGRTKAGESINHSVGLELLVHLGSHVSKGDVWIKIHCDEKLSEERKNILQTALIIKPEKHQKAERITKFITRE